MAMLRRGRYKLNYSLDDAPELYDMTDDPEELRNLAADPAYRRVLEELRTRLLANWDPVALERRVRQSQRERLLINAVESGSTALEAQRQWYTSGAAGGPPA
jgi:choline-sulfatase